MNDTDTLDLDFRSDNVDPAAATIVEAAVAANAGSTTPYGADPWSENLSAEMTRVFGRETTVMFTATATAANALGIAWLGEKAAPVYCHRHAHIAVAEAGAVPFFTGGSELKLIDGDDGKIRAVDLAAMAPSGGVLNLTQSTEAGTVYTLDELRALAEVAAQHGLKVHVDGARLANALVALACTPAAFVEAAAVDVLTFGSTKNGTMGAEAALIFGPCDRDRLREQWRRAGQLMSKPRYLSAQLLAYLAEDRWLGWARNANAAAARLAAGLAELPGVEIVWPTEANEVFATLTPAMLGALEAAGVLAREWPPAGATRLVCGFDTSMEAVDRVVAIARAAADGRQWSAA
jgi:threonine aldolase